MEKQQEDPNEDLLIQLLNAKPKIVELSKTDKWEHDLLYSIHQRTKSLDLVNILTHYNRFVDKTSDTETLSEANLV